MCVCVIYTHTPLVQCVCVCCLSADIFIWDMYIADIYMAVSSGSTWGRSSVSQTPADGWAVRGFIELEMIILLARSLAHSFTLSQRHWLSKGRRVREGWMERRMMEADRMWVVFFCLFFLVGVRAGLRKMVEDDEGETGSQEMDD